MPTLSVAYKKRLEIRGSERPEVMELDAGISKIKEMAAVKSDRSYKNGRKRKGLDQTVQLTMHLGIDAKQADQAMRGAISLPKGIGKSRRVIAFCEGELAAAAKAAGAIEAGADELIDKIQKENWFEFDVAVAHPSLMGKVGKLGRVLGPHGLMPTPKAGTVTPDVVTAVKEFAAGRIEFRNDAGGNVHVPVGKASFAVADIKANVEAVIAHMARSKPATAKGQFFKKVCLAAMNTPSVILNVGQ
ncbi:MAG: 50S ribosomal protein L1 [Phycisphaerales bacterium]|nr:50S ribosomal protein L1 [Phycisphaerales bacterium]